MDAKAAARAAIFIPLAEQSRRRFAKPQTLVRFQHGIPAFALRAPARRAILSGIGVERHTPVFQTGIEGAIPSCPSISQVNLVCRQRPRTVEVMAGRRIRCAWDFLYATRNPGAGQDITGLAAAVQLRLRVAVGLQALQRCSGLLNRRARGSTVATHHFGGGTRIEKFVRSLACPARRIKLLPSASSSVSTLL